MHVITHARACALARAHASTITPTFQLQTLWPQLISLGMGGALDSYVTNIYRLASGLQGHLTKKALLRKDDGKQLDVFFWSI